MLNRLSDKLLSKYPILWNSKLPLIIPVALIVYTIITMMCFLLTPTTFETYLDDLGLPIVGASILISLVIFLLWVTLLNRNQSIKNFYPRSSLSIYKEWIGLFLITVSIFATNLSYITGVKLRWDTYYDTEQLQKDIQILQKASILLPRHKYQYEAPFQSERQTIDNKSEILILKDSTYMSLQSISSDIQATLEIDSFAYLESSLLYFSSNYYFESDSLISKVKKLLMRQKKKEIRQIMSDYLALNKRLDIVTNLTEDVWMDSIYKPPFYPVTDNSFFASSDYNYHDYRMSNKNYRDEDIFGFYYTPFENIQYYLYHIDDYKNDRHNDIQEYTILILYIALYFSILIFGSRLFSGRVLIYTIVSSLLLIILFAILASFRIMDKDFYPITFILSLFIILSYIVLDTYRKRYLNTVRSVSFLLWILNIPILFTAIFDVIDSLIPDNSLLILSILCTIITWIPISALARNIKSLAHK